MKQNAVVPIGLEVASGTHTCRTGKSSTAGSPASFDHPRGYQELQLELMQRYAPLFNNGVAEKNKMGVFRYSILGYPHYNMVQPIFGVPTLIIWYNPCYKPHYNHGTNDTSTLTHHDHVTGGQHVSPSRVAPWFFVGWWWMEKHHQSSWMDTEYDTYIFII